MPMKLSSSAFASGANIPDRYTKSGADDQPELIITGVPEDARELAVICHDPDAPVARGFTHWTLYGIPPDTTEIPENGASFRAGPNDYGETGYGGPQPPPGHGAHTYYFWVYALDTTVEGEPDRETFLHRYGGHILEQARLVGLYENS